MWWCGREKTVSWSKRIGDRSTLIGLLKGLRHNPRGKDRESWFEVALTREGRNNSMNNKYETRNKLKPLVLSWIKRQSTLKIKKKNEDLLIISEFEVFREKEINWSCKSWKDKCWEAKDHNHWNLNDEARALFSTVCSSWTPWKNSSNDPDDAPHSWERKS